MELTIQVIDVCNTLFEKCKHIESRLIQEVRPIEEAIHKATNCTQMIIDICTEKITKLEDAISDIEINIIRLMTIQNLDVSSEMIELIISTITDIRLLQNNIREDLLETATERGVHIRARDEKKRM